MALIDKNLYWMLLKRGFYSVLSTNLCLALSKSLDNTAERMMKLICLGRKNYLFCGSELVAKNTSLIYSIIETCKMNGLRPVKYIADVLRKLIEGETDYASLLPVSITK